LLVTTPTKAKRARACCQVLIAVKRLLYLNTKRVYVIRNN
jgi:hypothetical protein